MWEKIMNVILLVSIILGVSAQNIIKKPYTLKSGGKGAFLFSMFSSLAAMLFFVVTSGGFKFDIGFVPYALGFALSYGAATVFSVLATACGSLSLTALIISFSLMIPTFYGLIFLNDPISVGLIPGLLLLAISLVLINKTSESVKITRRWVIYVFLAFVGNGMCSTVQKMQQVAFDGAYKNEFMIVALLAVTFSMGIISLVKEKRDIKVCAHIGWYLALGCGVMNGVVNLFVMLLSARMPVSLMFPLVSAGGIVITYLVSRFIYKEKLTKLQLVGFVLGTASVVLLNI